MSKMITDKKDESIANGASGGGAGPSVRVEDEPTFARFCALLGACCAVVGCVALWMTTIGGRTNLYFGPGWGGLLLFIGVCGLLFHAVIDKDLQFRLMYLVLGGLLFVVGVGVSLMPYPGHMGGLFGVGFLCLFTALLFVLAVLRHETDAVWRDRVQRGLLAAGALMALIGLIGGTISTDFLTPYGLLLAILGLLYLLSFVGTRGGADDLAFRTGWVILAVGVLTFLIAACRSGLPPLFHALKWTTQPPAEYGIPYGLTLMVIGAAYAAAAYLTCSDAPLAVLTRRELGAFFYSPMAYLLLFGFTVIGWISFGVFFSLLYRAHEQKQPLIEPVVQYYLFSLLPALAMVFVVPVLTMRLLSEEKRAGTLEVLLTAPVEESTVVLSKFFAGLLMFLITWLPFFLFLIPMAVGGAPFDYRPLLSFTLGLTICGAGMVAMGLFFSSLTRNQLVGAVLTFAGMLCLTAIYLVRDFFREGSEFWTAVLKHVSFLDSWQDTLQGKVTPTIGLVFYASMAVFFLFLTVKVLESRKWW
jgi:gliding motility-associated transport system permease protein